MTKKDKEVVPEPPAKSKKHLKIAAALIMVALWGLYVGFERAEFRAEPTTTTLYNFSRVPSTTYPVFEMDETLFLGYNYQNEYSMHIVQLGLQAKCYNHKRVNYVYVSNGYIDFDLKASGPGVLKILSINLNPLGCRENRVYIDGLYIGTIHHPPRSEDYQVISVWDVLNVTPTEGRLHVTISHDEQASNCRWGNDISVIRFMPLEVYLKELEDHETPELVAGDEGV